LLLAQNSCRGADRRGPGETNCPVGSRRRRVSEAKRRRTDRKAPWLLRKKQAKSIRLPQNKNTPEILQDFRVMGQGPMALAGCRGRAPAGVRGKAPLMGQGPMALAGSRGSAPGGGGGGKAPTWVSKGQSPLAGVSGTESPTGVWGKAPHQGPGAEPLVVTVSSSPWRRWPGRIPGACAPSRIPVRRAWRYRRGRRGRWRRNRRSRRSGPSIPGTFPCSAHGCC